MHTPKIQHSADGSQVRELRAEYSYVSPDERGMRSETVWGPWQSVDDYVDALYARRGEVGMDLVDYMKQEQFAARFAERHPDAIGRYERGLRMCTVYRTPALDAAYDFWCTHPTQAARAAYEAARPLDEIVNRHA